jgi:enoyl-CoA hydratase/carnithine racemase
MSVPYIYCHLVKETVGSRTGRLMLMGTKILVADCKRLNIVQDTYTTDEELNAEIADFVKERAKIGQYRETYSASKMFMFNGLLDKMQNSEIFNIGTIHETLLNKKMADDFMKQMGITEMP